MKAISVAAPKRTFFGELRTQIFGMISVVAGWPDVTRPDWWLEVAKTVAVGLTLTLCLLGSSRLFSQSSEADTVMSLNFCSRETQWMMFACACGYYLIFSCLQNFLKPKNLFAAARPSFFLLITLLMVLVAYLLDYRVASSSTKALILVFSVALGKGAEFWAAAATRPGQLKQLFLRILIPLLIILTCACFYNFNSATDFQYRGQTRWVGVWSDPNNYGLLMGAGVILSVSLLLTVFPRRTESSLRAFGVAVLLAVTLVLFAGLLRSYSRGSWLGTICGLSYLFFWTAGRAHLPKTGLFAWLRRNGAVLLIVPMALFVLAFWQFKHSEQHLARRSFSTGNVNDTSWRNRVSAWEGSFQMMAERPWFGTGWNKAAQIYDSFYRTDKIMDAAAITTNDYALLGVSVGLPAVICFLAYLAWSLTRNLRRAASGGPGEELDGEADPDLKAVQLLQAGFRGGAIILLIGFWFDGGLFFLPTAALFWVLLDLGRARISGSGGAPSSGPNEKRSNYFSKFFVGVLLLVFGAMLWAKSDDSCERKEFTGHTTSHARPTGIAIYPKGAKNCPVMIYAHDARDAWHSDGIVLRQFTELGFAAVSFDYAHGDAVEPGTFDDQFSSVLDYVKTQAWADPASIAWVGTGLGGDNLLRHAVNQSDEQPRLFVRMGGSWISELDAPASIAALHFPFLLVHGDDDNIAPVEDSRKFAAALHHANLPATLQIIPGADHNFGADRAEVMRLAGEFCKAKLTPTAPRPQFAHVAPYPIWLCLLPAAGWFAFWFWRSRRGKVTAATELSVPTWKKFELGLRIAAVVLVLLAAAQTAFRLIIPRLPATGKNLAIAQKSFVPAKWQADFATLTAQPVWEKQKIKTILENVELSHYTVNELINWKVDPDKYRDYVLSPVIAEDQAELNWRRELWDNFYRRVRKENLTENAAEIVVRFLRERVTVVPDYAKQPGVESIWASHLASPDDFEIIYTAALRSVGIPARLTTERKVEFWTGSEWQLAPRPLAATWVG